MTDPNQQHCAYCAYRRAAGTLTIRSRTTTRTESTCWNCAREALAYYATEPERVSFTARRNR